MQEHRIEITYRQHDNFSTLDAKDRELVRCAQDSQKYSYAPYSRFHVGAAVRLENGEMVGNGNQENVSYPLCLCAERSVLATVAARNAAQSIQAIAVTANATNIIVAPCGACRQVMFETEARQGKPIKVFLQGPDSQWLEFSSVNDLLPFPFGPDSLLNRT